MNNHEIAVLGGGCFWCTEAVFQDLRGVLTVDPGYAGGTTTNPTYEQVCSGTTGHAEVVRITFDPDQISYQQLLEVFFGTHDPTSLNQQGADVGTQYRSIILYADEAQRQEAEKVKQELETSGAFERPIVTEIKPLDVFYHAEEYHRGYFKRHPEQAYCQAVINLKMKKLREHYHNLLK
jgi:peptide-methionine (S)-S-oxide reductase